MADEEIIEINNQEPEKIFDEKETSSKQESIGNDPIPQMYNFREIVNTFQVRLIPGEIYRTEEFYHKVMSRIKQVNQAMGNERLIILEENKILSHLPKDFIFKFDILCFGKNWT